MSRLLVILFLIPLNSSHGNPIQISLSGLRDPSTALSARILRILIDPLDNSNLLQCLQHLPIYAARRIDVVVGSAAAVLGAAVDFGEAADTDGLAEVDVAGDGGGADVEPVLGLRRKFV